MATTVMCSGLALAGEPAAQGERRDTVSGTLKGCLMTREGTNVELRSPWFVFRLNTVPRLSAESWENRLTGTKISLGGGPELELDIGETEKAAQKVEFAVVQLPEVSGREQQAGEAVFKLKAKEHPISATVTYRWDATQPVLRKFVEVVNGGDRELNRLLNVRLGTYRTDGTPTGGARGFPVYLNGERFLTLAHPSGWGTSSGNELSLRQYPGIKLAAGQRFTCMETVYGVGQANGGRDAFLKYVTSRMRRIVRGHDKPYAIFEPFGAKPGQRNSRDFDETEAFVLDNIARVAEGQRDSGCRFDYYSVDFWHDVQGDLTRFDPGRFPNGFARIKQALAATGMLPGLWIDSGGLPDWTFGRNPAIKPAMTQPDGGGTICRATEPAKSLYTTAFLHHIRENGVRLFKFDNMGPDCKEPMCNNPNHSHLPGIYSVEAIHNALIEFLQALDKECPDVFLMLYWGYKSPWWLLYGDTLFESGIHIEAASASSQAASYARDSVTQRLDQGLKHGGDIPRLGKDSLGIWLSDWPWNSCVGKDRWQEGFVMDLCRGGLLAQIWSDTNWLTPPERAQMAEFIALFKAQPGCFRNSRPIVGDPAKDEPYGYCCSDGKRAFLAIHNACLWKDNTVTLELNSKWGLPDGRSWDIYRWYPTSARLAGQKPGFGESASICLRPFEVVLLEVVPAGEARSLSRTWKTAPLQAGFAEPTRMIALGDTVPSPAQTNQADKSTWTPLDITSAVSAGGATLAKQKDGSILAGGKNPSNDEYTVIGTTKLTGITGIQLEVLCDTNLPGNGPGRAVNGNFALTGFTVAAAPLGNAAETVPAPLQNAKADFFQESHGGWPLAAAIDDNPQTGWSIDPAEGAPHVAIFETAKPIGFAAGTTLTLKLTQGPREHSIGRFRLSVTAAQPPIPIPAGYGTAFGRTTSGLIPPAAKGGTLVVVAPVFMAGELDAMIEGEPASSVQVWNERAFYPATWQAWRIPVGPSPGPRNVDLTLKSKNGRIEVATWKMVFIPGDKR